MNNPNEHPLENVLSGLSPAAPSPSLSHHVDEELKLDMTWLSAAPRTRPSSQWRHSLTWAALGAAAAVAVMSIFSGPPQDASAAGQISASPSVLPVSTIREWDAIQDDGIHYSKESLPEQHVRVIARERQTWIDPRDGAEMTVEYPREQRFVLPVSFQ